MISGREGGKKFTRALSAEALMGLHRLLPLKYKFRPETLVLTEGNEILGLITVQTTPGNPYKINITRLLFKQNHNDAGKQLVEYVIAKYGAKGAMSFSVAVDEAHGELMDLFISGCGFRQCSCEELWKAENFNSAESCINFRPALNSDAQTMCDLYNNELIGIYHPSLERKKEEYREPLFAGLRNNYKIRYVLEQENQLLAYLSITVSDNLNLVTIDISKTDMVSYNEMLNFAINEISKRKSGYQILAKLRKYVQGAEEFENCLQTNGFARVNTQFILVKDFYTPIKEQTLNPLQVFLFGERQVLSS